MKKLIAISIAVLMVLGISTMSYADELSTEKIVAVTLTVGSTFGFRIWDDQLDQTLEPYGEEYPDPLDPDTIINPALGALNLFVTTNADTPWQMNASSIGCVDIDVDPSFFVPLLLTSYAGGDAWAGVGTGEDGILLTGSPAAIYTSGADEDNVSDFEIAATFLADPATAIPEGDYVGSMTLTLVAQP